MSDISFTGISSSVSSGLTNSPPRKSSTIAPIPGLSSSPPVRSVMSSSQLSASGQRVCRTAAPSAAASVSNSVASSRRNSTDPLSLASSFHGSQMSFVSSSSHLPSSSSLTSMPMPTPIPSFGSSSSSVYSLNHSASLGLPSSSSVSDQLTAARRKLQQYQDKVKEYQLIVQELETAESGGLSLPPSSPSLSDRTHSMPQHVATAHNAPSHSQSAAAAEQPGDVPRRRRSSSVVGLPAPLTLQQSKSQSQVPTQAQAQAQSQSQSSPHSSIVAARKISSGSAHAPLSSGSLTSSGSGHSGLIIQTVGGNRRSSSIEGGDLANGNRNSQSSDQQGNSDSNPSSPFSGSRQRSQQRASNSSTLNLVEPLSPLDAQSSSPILSASLITQSHSLQPLSLSSTFSQTQPAAHRPTRSSLVSNLNLSSPGRAQLLKPGPVPELDPTTRSEPHSPALPPVRAVASPAKFNAHVRVSSIVEVRQTAERLHFGSPPAINEEPHSALPTTQVSNFTRSGSRNLPSLALPIVHNRSRSSSVPHLFPNDFPPESDVKDAAAHSAREHELEVHSAAPTTLDMEMRDRDLPVRPNRSSTTGTGQISSSGTRSMTPLSHGLKMEESSSSSSSSNFSSPRGLLSRGNGPDSHRSSSSINDSPRLLNSGSSTDRGGQSQFTGSSVSSMLASPMNAQTPSNFSMSIPLGPNIGIQPKAPPVPVLARVVITQEDNIHDITDIFSPRNEFEEAEAALHD